MFLLFSCLLYCVLANENPEVLTKYGKIQGTYISTTNQRCIAAFEGIPYAKPPIGNLRFEPPQPPDVWNFTLVANKVVTCLQYPVFYPRTEIIGVEDCLYINVYSSNIHPEANLDVLIHIHGGGFMTGAANYYRPHNLMDHDIVYVNFNYRLNVFGFLSTEDTVAPGNYGMKDQVLAMKWVKENIKNFGGNPDSITLTGFSAGGASVHLHYLSPLSKGLFHRGISLSGTAYNPWVLAEGNLEKAQKLAKLTNCPTENNRAMVNCLKTVPGNQLTSKIKYFMEFLYVPFTPFGVVIENKDVFQPFLTEYPREILKNGYGAKLPWLASVTENEGLWPTAGYMKNPGTMWHVGKNWDKLAPFLLDYYYSVNISDHREMAHKIKQFYFKEKEVDRFSLREFEQMMTERYFKVGAFNAAIDQAKFSPVYFYKFKFRGIHSSTEDFFDLSLNLGVCHGDDAAYLVPGSLRYSSGDNKMKDFMTGIWAAFARTGQPISFGIKHWPRVNLDRTLTYLDILRPFTVSVQKSDNFGNSDFWNNLISSDL